MDNIKLGIGIPLGSEWIPAQFWFSYENLKKPIGYKLICMAALTPVAREQIVVKALKEDCTHLLFIDSDMTFREDAFYKLLVHDKDICHGKFYSRYEPYAPCIWINGKQENPLKFCKIDHAGLAFSLIKMDVFKKIPRPWFEFKMTDKEVTGEDVAFHTKAKQYGFEAYCDPEVYVGHLTTFAIRRNDDGMLKITKN
jgi:hypothetical protein